MVRANPLLARSEALEAGAELTDLSLASIEQLKRHGFDDIADAAVDSLGAMGQLNVESVARIDDLLGGSALDLSANLRSKLGRARQALSVNLKDSDLSGALQESVGIPTGFDHIDEILNARTSLTNARKAIDDRIDHARFSDSVSPAEMSRLQNTREALDSMIRGTDSILGQKP